MDLNFIVLSYQSNRQHTGSPYVPVQIYFLCNAEHYRRVCGMAQDGNNAQPHINVRMCWSDFRKLWYASSA